MSPEERLRTRAPGQLAGMLEYDEKFLTLFHWFKEMRKEGRTEIKAF
jgi:hypothetical protein